MVSQIGVNLKNTHGKKCLELKEKNANNISGYRVFK